MMMPQVTTLAETRTVMLLELKYWHEDHATLLCLVHHTATGDGQGNIGGGAVMHPRPCFSKEAQFEKERCGSEGRPRGSIKLEASLPCYWKVWVASSPVPHAAAAIPGGSETCTKRCLPKRWLKSLALNHPGYLDKPDVFIMLKPIQFKRAERGSNVQFSGSFPSEPLRV